jgi:hypothetical protein
MDLITPFRSVNAKQTVICGGVRGAAVDENRGGWSGLPRPDDAQDIISWSKMSSVTRSRHSAWFELDQRCQEAGDEQETGQTAHEAATYQGTMG